MVIPVGVLDKYLIARRITRVSSFQRLQTRLRANEPWQRTLLIMFFVQLTSAVGFSLIFPFLPLYVQYLGARSSLSIEFLSGMVFSAQAITMMFASPFWGAVADRFGRKLMVERAAFGGTVLLLAMAFVQSAEALVLLRAAQGLVTGTVAAANALVAAEAPRERTGYAMGIIQVGLWGGVALGPIIGGTLADAFGYRMTFVLTSILLLISGILVHFWVNEDFQRPAGGGGGAVGFLRDWRHIFATPGVGTAYTLRFLSGLARTVIVPIAPLFLVTLLPNSERINLVTGLMIGVGSAATTATAVYLGRLGDRLGHRRVLIAAALGAGLFYIPQSMVTASWQLVVLQVLSGAAAGGIIPSVSALLTTMTTQGEEGSVFGLDNSITAAARAVAPLIGAGIALRYDYRAVFLATGVIFGLLALIAALRLPRDAPIASSAGGSQR